jgi:hypothetical protein
VGRGIDHYDAEVAQSTLCAAPRFFSPGTMRILLSTAGLAALAVTAAAAFAAPARPAQQQRCHPSYPDYCIPPPPPDLDCPDITGRKPFRVRHDVRNADPHGFDRDQDGRACEPRPQRRRS